MSKNLNKEEMKKLVEELVKSLAQKGISVGGGAVLKFKDNGEIESVDGFGSFDPKKIFGEKPVQKTPSFLPPDYLEKVMKMSFETERSSLQSSLQQVVSKLGEKLRERGIITSQPVSESNEEVQEEVTEDDNEDCTCPSCLTFDNFEEKLGKKGPNFDYGEVTLGGKKFKIKYHVADSGEENISMRDCSEDVDLKNSTTEALQLFLQEAVRDKKFDKAQLILNAIQERKNKN